MLNHKGNKQVQSVEEMLATIDGLNGDEEVKEVIRRFLKNSLLVSNGIIIIYTYGKHVGIDGTKFSEPEAIWALQKAQHQLLNKGLSFND